MAERTALTAADVVVLDERFYEKTVEVAGPLQTPCWHWTGRVDDNGKGRKSGKLYWGRKGQGGRPVAAYRLALAARLGISLEALGDRKACHSCDDPMCVNPNHLRADSQQNNMQEAWDKGRLTKQMLKEAHRRAMQTKRELAYLDERFWMAMAAD